jgi:tRNA threonylcarbamoyl adenosine modification protein YjeE
MVRHLLHSLNETESLARKYAKTAQKGDVFLLSGELGTGKSTFARAFIRSYLNAPFLEVPSPTYTLIQTYGSEGYGTLHHLDLYRLSDSEEMDELGLEYEDSITLIEWPERLSDATAPDRFIRIQFSLTDGLHVADVTQHNMSHTHE